jgi:tryptophan synthase alpha chain
MPGTNPIDQAFQKAKGEGKTLLIPYVTAGDPHPDVTVDILIRLQSAGSAMIELGVPYSDPLADGPVIQRASQRALKHRITISSCLDIARKAKGQGLTIPLILFTYYNPVLQYGAEKLFGQLRREGFAAVIIPDLPIEESDEFQAIAESAGIYLVPFVAPTSKERIQRIVASANGGFIYCVSSLGVTGERSELYQGIESFIRTVRESTDVPLAVGFGVSKQEHFAQLSEYVDGVIIGSAIIRKIEEVLESLENAEQRTKALDEIEAYVGHFLL